MAHSPRFITITLNPALDRTVEVDEMRLGEVVRAKLLFQEPAGKGVNAAHTLAAVGNDVLAAGFIGKREEHLFRQGFEGARVTPEFTLVEGLTRVSVTILDRKRDQETHITEQGFEVSRGEVAALLDKAASLASPEAWVAVNGRPAPGFGVEDYARLVRAVKAKGAKALADTSGPFLAAAVDAGADAIKPNDEELGELVGRALDTRSEVIEAAREVAGKVPCVVVSLGADGALCVCGEGVWHGRETVQADVVHTVGCGDALAMGFMSGIARAGDPAEALRLAVACGGACVRTPRAALRERREVDAVLPNVEVTRLGD